MNHRISPDRPVASTRPALLLSLLPMAVLASMGLVACGSTTSSTTTQNPDTQSTAAAPAENSAANGEAAPHPYTNSKYNYRVDAPGTMKEAPDGSAAYLGTVERLQIVVVSGASAADPHNLAVADSGALAAAKTAFKLVQPASQINLSGRTVTKFIYTWTDGANPVTGKPNNLVSVQYYIP